MFYPIISVIMIITNKGEYVCDAIDSVVKQSYPHWELILIHTGKDATVNAIVKRYTTRDSRILSHIRSDSSQNALYTAGIQKAQGEWVCFLAEEDMYTHDRFSTLIENTFVRPDVQFFHTSYIIKDKNHSAIAGISFADDLTITKLFSPLSFMRTHAILLSSIFVLRSIVPTISPVPSNIQYSYLFSLMMYISSFARASFINNITCHHRTHLEDVAGYVNMTKAVELEDMQYKEIEGTAIEINSTFEEEKEHAIRPSASVSRDSLIRTTAKNTNVHSYDMQFDIGTVCVSLLHSYSIKEITPFLQSNDSSVYRAFITGVLGTALFSHSLFYSCGVNTLLLERILEWLANDSPVEFRKELHEHVSSIILAQFSHIHPVLQEMCSKIIHHKGSYSFTPEAISIILARSGADILRTNPSTVMLYMSYCQKTFPDIYSTMLMYFHDTPTEKITAMTHKQSPIPATQGTSYIPNRTIQQ